MADKAVFLDRDGTLIKDPGYINNPDQVELLEGVPRALRELRELGYKIIVVSNQSGVARGIVSVPTLEKIHNRLKELLAKEDAFLDRIYYCPFHPEGAVKKYRKDSDWRKPQPGMLLAAARDFGLELGQCWMIGDEQRDVEAGFRAGCKTIMLTKRQYYEPPRPGDIVPDYKCLSLREAVNIIKQYHRARPSTPQPSETQAAAPVEQSVEPCEENTPVPRQQETSVAEQAKAEPLQQGPAVEEPRVDEPSPPQAKTDDQQQLAPQSRTIRDSDAPPEAAGGRTEYLLAEIVEQLRMLRREEMFSEFSLARLAAQVLQIVVLLCLMISVWFLLDVNRKPESVLIALGFAVLFQLMSLTFHLMQTRK